MLTQTQYELLSLDAMKKGIYDTVIKFSPILSRIPQIDVEGKSILYNIESSMAGASWYNPGDTWTESVAVPIQRTTSLKILGQDADVDTFMNQTRSNINDQMALAIKGKAKAIAHEFEKQFMVGGTTSTPDGKSFDGVFELVAQNETTANQTTSDLDGAGDNVHILSTNSESGALTLGDLDELRDLIKPGSPDAYVTGRRGRRRIGQLARASGSVMRETQDSLGRMVTEYDGIPILVNDWTPENIQDATTHVITTTSYGYGTARASGYDNSVILAAKFGVDDFYVIQNGGVVTEEIGTLETKDAVRTRLKWYVGLCNPNIYALALAINFNPDTA